MSLLRDDVKLYDFFDIQLFFIVNEKWESVTERLKTGLEQQEDVLAQMDIDLATKREGLSNIGEENEKLIQNISDKNGKMEKLKQEKEHVEDQKERLKIKVFELETEVQKLQQEVKKEASKKDTATQALKDGLEIVKSKKKEYETKMKATNEENEKMNRTYKKQVRELKEEITRLKSIDSESCTDEKIVSVLKYFYLQRMFLRYEPRTSVLLSQYLFFIYLPAPTSLLQ